MKLAARVAGIVVVAVAVLAAGCACKGSGSGGTGPGTGTGTGTGAVDTSCEGEVAHVRALYQAAAGAGTAAAEQPALTDAEVGDNVAMVMKECAAAPATVGPCLAAARDVAQLEARCLPALDDDGSEGRIFLAR